MKVISQQPVIKMWKWFHNNPTDLNDFTSLTCYVLGWFVEILGFPFLVQRILEGSVKAASVCEKITHFKLGEESPWIKVSAERLKWCQTLDKCAKAGYVKHCKARNQWYTKIQSSDWPKWRCILWHYVNSFLLSDLMSFQMARKTVCQHIN